MPLLVVYTAIFVVLFAAAPASAIDDFQRCMAPMNAPDFVIAGMGDEAYRKSACDDMLPRCCPMSDGCPIPDFVQAMDTFKEMMPNLCSKGSACCNPAAGQRGAGRRLLATVLE